MRYNKKIVNEGVNKIIDMCNEVLTELEKENPDENSIADILMDDIPLISEKLVPVAGWLNTPRNDFAFFGQHKVAEDAINCLAKDYNIVSVTEVQDA